MNENITRILITMARIEYRECKLRLLTYVLLFPLLLFALCIFNLPLKFNIQHHLSSDCSLFAHDQIENWQNNIWQTNCLTNVEKLPHLSFICETVTHMLASVVHALGMYWHGLKSNLYVFICNFILDYFIFLVENTHSFGCIIWNAKKINNASVWNKKNRTLA